MATQDAELVEHEVESSSLMAINASEINQQIATAKKYPRSIKEFIREATEMATLNPDIAAECMYSLKRRDSDGGANIIEGPSARFAEIVASAWGNCHAGARVIAEDDRFVTAQGAFFDMQRNVRITYEVRRRITTKNGKTFGDDMIGVTANAACSIALRNAVFKGVPKAFWNDIFLKARATAVGDAKTLEMRRHEMLVAFEKMGVPKAKVFAYVEVPGAADINLDHLAHLIGVFNAIRSGEQKIDDVFNQPSGPSRSEVGSKFGRDKEMTSGAGSASVTTETATATVANNDVRDTTTNNAEQTGGAPADAWAVDWLNMIAELNTNMDLDTFEQTVKESKSLTADRKLLLVGKIKERRKALK